MTKLDLNPIRDQMKSIICFYLSLFYFSLFRLKQILYNIVEAEVNK
jgi:hypothetical protein